MSWAHWASSVALTAANRQAAPKDRPQGHHLRPGGQAGARRGGQAASTSAAHGKDQTGPRGAVGVRCRRDRLTVGVPLCDNCCTTSAARSSPISSAAIGDMTPRSLQPRTTRRNSPSAAIMRGGAGHLYVRHAVVAGAGAHGPDGQDRPAGGLPGWCLPLPPRPAARVSSRSSCPSGTCSGPVRPLWPAARAACLPVSVRARRAEDEAVAGAGCRTLRCLRLSRAECRLGPVAVQQVARAHAMELAAVVEHRLPPQQAQQVHLPVQPPTAALEDLAEAFVLHVVRRYRRQACSWRRRARPLRRPAWLPGRSAAAARPGRRPRARSSSCRRPGSRAGGAVARGRGRSRCRARSAADRDRRARPRAHGNR